MTSETETSGPPAGSSDGGTAPAAESAHATTAGSTRIPRSPLRRPLRRRLLRLAAAGTALVALGSASASWIAYHKLDGNIRTDSNTARVLGGYEDERPLEVATEATDILLIGTDDRSGPNARYGSGSGTERSDTTILLHLSADRRSATGVSIPRDLVTPIPACRQEDGSETRPRLAQFNWAFQSGGAACTIRTVENMTGIRVDHHMIVDFTGFKKMVDAVGGVEICLARPVEDQDAELDLPAGRQTVGGEDALAYVRARYSFGNGSDTQRIGRQQQFLASLVKKVKSTGVLLNPARLYPLLDAATSSLTADAELDSLSELYGLVRSLQKTPTEGIGFLTVPRRPYVLNPNRDQLVQPAADELFAALREDRPVKVAESGEETQEREPEPSGSGIPRTGNGESGNGVSHDDTARSSSAPSGTAASESSGGPAFPGTTPDDDICSGS